MRISATRWNGIPGTGTAIASALADPEDHELRRTLTPQAFIGCDAQERKILPHLEMIAEVRSALGEIPELRLRPVSLSINSKIFEISLTHISP
jgi:hypothetical protein